MTGTLTVIAAAAAAAMAIAAPASAQPVNFSSHSAEFFRELASGRVLVTGRSGHHYGHGYERLQAVHLHPSGEAARCTITRDDRNDTTHPFARSDLRWRILGRSHAQFRLWRGEEPRRARGGIPIFYEPATGRTRAETYVNGRWRHLADGWIQDTWPRVMLDACPDLPAPLPVNEAQTAHLFAELEAQDPSAPIRDFPGSEFRAPGATGLGASGGRPTIAPEEVAAFMRASHGTVLLNPVARRRVLVLLDGREELWAIGDDDSVLDVAHFERSADGATVGLRWETGESPKWRYRVGYPVPYVPTGERFAAFRLGDWLAGQPRVTLPYMGREVGFRFRADGTLEAGRTDGGTAPGTWRWSRGSLEIRVPGVEDVATYEWKALAELVGWEPPRKGE